jgi:hypothetical protein
MELTRSLRPAVMTATVIDGRVAGLRNGKARQDQFSGSSGAEARDLDGTVRSWLVPQWIRRPPDEVLRRNASSALLVASPEQPGNLTRHQ